MPIIKRWVVWFVETTSEILLVSLFLIALFGYGRRAPGGEEFYVFVAAVCWISYRTGYLLTTLIFRTFLRGRTLWLYPAIASSLVFIHFEILNVTAGGIYDRSTRIRILVASICIVFACTLVGSFALRRWIPSGTAKQPPRATNRKASDALNGT